MGVMNVTPNSFSDGGSLLSLASFQNKLSEFSDFEAIDIGAESTAPQNDSVSWETEWERLKVYLPLLQNYPGALSFDTYHPETLEEILRFYQDHAMTQDLIWNDVSGKFDHFAKDFLSYAPNFHYVFCHNLAPSRELAGRHMDYVDDHLNLESLRDYFGGFKIPQVIFDPCLGFSKSYEQNWMIFENFGVLQQMVGHNRWLMGFSRKSFLRKKHNLTLDQKDELDRIHGQLLQTNFSKWNDEVWVRSHT
jgi:dihydropteroate synthase